MLVARRAMRGTLPSALIHDAPLEMLLCLFVARPAAMAVADLVAETTVAPLVAGYWIDAIRAEGLIDVAGDGLTLSVAGIAAMETMLAAVVASQHDLLGWGH